MTTAGRFVNAPLGKAQCVGCASVQKVFEKRLADTDFYERAYTYYSRPGAEKFDTVRYEALARWVASSVADIKPRIILDIGCGRGWTMSAMKVHFPNAAYVGIEPTEEAVQSAREQGLEVHQGRLGVTEFGGEPFDLIYSNNVLQHTTDPVAFLTHHMPLLKDDGRIVLSCPDGSVPNVELMMADQNFSFSPCHLATICKKSGFALERWLPCPGGPLRHEQLVVLRKANYASSAAIPVCESIPTLVPGYDALMRYFSAWGDTNKFICSAIEGSTRVFNFGGGLWSYVLAAYCPDYWKQVKVCLVDGFAGQCLDKEVFPTEKIDLGPDDVVVLGTNPYVQDSLMQRFADLKVRVVSWHHIIQN